MPKLTVLTTFDWAHFARHFWSQRPVLYKRLAQPPFEQGEVFRAAVTAAHAHRADQAARLARFTIGREQLMHPDETLPAVHDDSFEDYDARVRALLGEQRYALIINGFHAHDLALWLRERAFFAPLWQQIGQPLTGAITTLFHGNYEHSPVGVHKDRFATFLYALRGRKRMRFWSRKPWRAAVSTVVDYQEYLGDSFIGDVEPGDLLYWPSSYYHIGESIDGAVATSVNIGIPIEEHQALYDVEDLLIGPFETPRLNSFGQHSAQSLPTVAAPMMVRAPQRNSVLAAGLPPALDAALRAMRERLQPTAMRESATHASLKRWTAGGFEPVPVPARRKALADAVVVCGMPAFPLRWHAAVGRGCWVAANGHLYRTTDAPTRVAPLLDALNSGRPATVSQLLHGFRAGAAPKQGAMLPAGRAGMRRLLEQLESCGAIRRVINSQVVTQ